jgi:flagellar export protein FliJ
MEPFRFRLDRVLGWRHTEMELAEAAYRQQMAELAAIDREKAELAATAVRAEISVKQGGLTEGRDLAALEGFRHGVHKRSDELAHRRVGCHAEVGRKQELMMEARRRCRLLEKLRERRYEEWTQARDRELEELASESFLARKNRELA